MAQNEHDLAVGSRNGLLGVYIHKLKDKNGEIDARGQNPFENAWLKKPDG